MAERKQFRAIKGVRDILPPDSSLWNWFESTARHIFETYGYREIRLPIFEQTELFARSIGADTDVVSKEMYTFEDHPFGELEDLKLQIRTRPIGLGNFTNLAIFDRDLESFIPEVRTLLNSGDISRSPENLRFIKTVESSFREMRDLLKAGALSKGDLQQRLVNHIETIQETVGEVVLGDVLTLRPEATASVVRAYIEHGMDKLPGNTKLYYVGPMFRRERPQKGRYRQFYQIGAEVLGQSDHPAIDAELIEMLTVLLGECGLTDPSTGSGQGWTLLVNSIGCQNCRPKYVEKLRAALQSVKGKMCGDCQRRAETNPLRVLDCKVEADQDIIAGLPIITENLDEPCREHFSEFQRQLRLRGIESYMIAPRLVRGLDYYTRTTFEITSPVLGAQNALVGGGRYDGLSELLGGPPTKCIGFALGTDRFIEAIQATGKVEASQPVDVFIAWLGQTAYPAAVKLTRRLRDAGLSVELPPEEMKLKKSLGLADKLGARYAVLLGENEIATGRYTLRRLADGDQQQLAEDELVMRLKTER